MPSQQQHRKQIRYKARCKRMGTEYFLGYFKTYEEALEAELAFQNYWPQRTGG